jgi:hypothetical protein
MAALREAVIAAVTAATGVNPGEAAAGHGFLIAGDPNAYYPGFGVCYHCGALPAISRSSVVHNLS